MPLHGMQRRLASASQPCRPASAMASLIGRGTWQSRWPCFGADDDPLFDRLSIAMSHRKQQPEADHRDRVESPQPMKSVVCSPPLMAPANVRNSMRKSQHRIAARDRPCVRAVRGLPVRQLHSNVGSSRRPTGGGCEKAEKRNNASSFVPRASYCRFRIDLREFLVLQPTPLLPLERPNDGMSFAVQ